MKMSDCNYFGTYNIAIHRGSLRVSNALCQNVEDITTACLAVKYEYLYA